MSCQEAVPFIIVEDFFDVRIRTVEGELKWRNQKDHQWVYIGFSQNLDGLFSPPYAPAVPFFPTSSAISVKNAFVPMLPSSTHRICKSLMPSIPCPCYRRCLSTVTISTSLFTTIGRSLYLSSIAGKGREKLIREGFA